jgi:outer membrane receptor protein involved in Fe transport
VFVRTSLRAPGDRVTFVLGARADGWRSRPRQAVDPENALSFFSPSAAVLWNVRRGLSVRAGVARSHRTPTLDELHRGSRQGNVLTNPNPLLRPERLTGVETSAFWTGQRASARVTGFVNLLDDMVANITLGSTPQLIVRQKQNVDKARAYGIEIEGDLRPARSMTVTAQAMFVSSRFVEAPTSLLAGRRVPQMPRYQVGAGVSYAAAYAITTSLHWRATGVQYDDDQNTLALAAFNVLDGSVSRPVTGRFHVFVAFENLLDVEYDVGRTPNRTIGLPRTVRAGVRTFLP